MAQGQPVEMYLLVEGPEHRETMAQGALMAPKNFQKFSTRIIESDPSLSTKLIYFLYLSQLRIEGLLRFQWSTRTQGPRGPSSLRREVKHPPFLWHPTHAALRVENLSWSSCALISFSLVAESSHFCFYICFPSFPGAERNPPVSLQIFFYSLFFFFFHKSHYSFFNAHY